MSAKIAPWLFALALLAPSLAYAANEDRTILLLVNSAPGAPTPAEIVDYANTWPHSAPPPLQSFQIKDPEASYYLMTDRATGDFLAWLQANPQSARRKLEDYVLMVFPSPSDIPTALAALHADPYVDSADVLHDIAFHTLAAGEGNLYTSSYQQDDTQYGWDAMDLDIAWQITGGGYAQIAHIDTGVDTNHPALRAFAGTSYVGGSLMLAASKDVGLTGQPAQAAFDPSNVDEAKTMFIPASLCTPVDAFLAPEQLGHGTHTAGLLRLSVAHDRARAAVRADRRSRH